MEDISLSKITSWSFGFLGGIIWLYFIYGFSLFPVYFFSGMHISISWVIYCINSISFGIIFPLLSPALMREELFIY